MESQSDDDMDDPGEERAAPVRKTMSVASTESEMRQFGESDAEDDSENGAAHSNSNLSNKTGGRNSTVSTISMDQSSTFDFNEPVLATHSMIMKQRVPMPANLRRAVPSRRRRSQINDPGVVSSSDSSEDESSTFDLNKSVKVSDSIINKHTQQNFKRPTKPRHDKSAVESSSNSTKSVLYDSVNSDSCSGTVTESTWERGHRQIGQKRFYKPQVERRRKTASVERKSDSFPVPSTSATTSLTNPQTKNEGIFKEPLAGERLRIPSPASTIIVMSPGRVESLDPRSFSFSASGVSSQMFPSASKARRIIATENSSVTFSSNVNPSSHTCDSDGTTASEEEEEIGVDKLSSKTHVTGTTSSGEQEQMPGQVINNSSQIIDEYLDPDNSLLEANTDDDDLLGSEITAHETRDLVHQPPAASVILNENSFGGADVASSRSSQTPMSTDFGGSSGSEMSSACPSVIQRTASEYFALLEIALRNSQNIPYYEVPADNLGTSGFPIRSTFTKLKSAFINPGVLIPSNERLLAQTAQSFATKANEPKNPEPIDESSNEEVLDVAPNQIERRGFKRKPPGMRVRSSSLLRRHPSEIYSGIGSYIQRTNSQISNSQRSATSGPMGFDQFREEIIHSGEHRDQDFSVNNIHEGPINTGFTPIAIGIAEVETSEARISSGSTRSEKLSIDKIRSRTLEAIPESSPSNSPEELNTSNNLEMDILSAAEFSNAVVANSTKVSTRQNDRTRISSVTNKSERIRSASHKRMQKLENDNDTRETGNNDTLTSKRSSLPDPQTQIEDVFLKVSSKEAVDSVLGSERQSNSPITKVIRADPTIGSKSVKSPSAMPQSSVSFKNSPQANASMKNTTTISTKTSEEHAPIPSNEGSSKIQGKRGHELVSTSSWKHLSIAESNSDENDEILEKSQRSSASKLILRNKIHGSVIADIDELRLENSKDSAAARVSSIGKSSRVNKYSSSGEKLHDAIGSGKPELSQSKKRLAVVDNSDSDEEMISSSSDENDEILEKSQHSAVSKLILRNKSYGSVIADIDELRLEKSKDSAAARISSTEKSSRVNKYSSSGDAIGSGKTEHSQSKKRLAVVDNSDSDEEMISRTSMKTLNKKRPPHAESSDDDLAENTITRLSSSAKSQLFVENSDQNLQEIKASKVKNYSRKNSSFETENTDCNADSNVLRNSLVRSFSHKTNKSSNQPQPLTSSRTTSLQASESQQFLRKDPSRDILFADDSGMQRNKQESSMHRSNAGRVLRLPSESESELPAPSRTSSPNCSPKGSPAKHVTVDLADKTETVHLAHRSCLEPENVIVIAKDIDLRIEDANDEGATSNIISVIDSQIRETPHRKISGRLKSSKISFEKSPERHHPTVFVEKSQSDDDSSDASVDKETSHCQNLLLARTSQKKKTSDKPPSFNTSKQTSVLHSESSPSKSQSINPHRKISGRQKSSKIIFEKSPERHPTVFVEKSQSGDDSSDASVDKETSHCENLLLARTSPKKKTSDEPPSFSTSKQALVLHSESSSSKSQNRNKRKSTMTPGSSDNDSVSLTVKKSYSKRGRMAESVEDNNKNSHDLTAGNQAAPVDVAIIEEDISAGKKSATRKRKLVGNTQQDHDSGSQGRINLLPSVASSEIPSTSRGSRFQTKSTKKAPTRKPKKDFGYYRNNAGIVKKEHVMAGLQVIGVKANKSRVEALTTFASKELENMLDELMASTTKDRDNGIFTYRELELALKRRKLLDPDLGKNALLLHMASVWDRTAYDKAKGVLLPKIGSYNT